MNFFVLFFAVNIFIILALNCKRKKFYVVSSLNKKFITAFAEILVLKSTKFQLHQEVYATRSKERGRNLFDAGFSWNLRTDKLQLPTLFFLRGIKEKKKIIFNNKYFNP